MKNLAKLRCTNMPWTVCLLTLLSSTVGLASDWQLITQPKINYLSSIGIGSNLSGNASDVNHVLLSAEHDGEWSNSSSDQTLRWTFSQPGWGYFQVHGTRYLAAPKRPQNEYFLDLHGKMTYYSIANNTWWALELNPDGLEDGWYSLAIDPTDDRLAGQKLLAGGPGEIKYGDGGGSPPGVSKATISRPLPLPPFDTNTYITDIQYAPDVTNPGKYVWAATSEAAGWDEVPVAGSGITLRKCEGVLRSTDFGVTWNAYWVRGTDTDFSNCVYAVAPISSTQVYAATRGGLWRGTFNQGTVGWTEIVPTGLSPGQRISSIFYPSGVSNPQTLYVALARPPPSTNGVLKGTTTDGGQSWTWVTMPFSTAPKVNALGGLLDNADTFYAAFSTGDVQRRNLDGSLTTLQGQHAGYPMATVAIPPNQTNDGTVYVGTVCQGGVYKGVYDAPTVSWGWTTQKKPVTALTGVHSHFHYVMRLAQDPADPLTTYVTEDNFVFNTHTGGGVLGDEWNRVPPNPGCDPQNPQPPQCVHVHGLAVAPSLPGTLYVGSGHGNWPGGTDSSGLTWRSTDSGVTWLQKPFSLRQPAPGTCVEQNNIKTGCYSVYTIAVSPNNPNRVFVGTFGHENYAGQSSLNDHIKSGQS